MSYADVIPGGAVSLIYRLIDHTRFELLNAIFFYPDDMNKQDGNDDAVFCGLWVGTW